MPRIPDTALTSTFTKTTHASIPPNLDPETYPLPSPFNALILGASRGIGAGIARAYARAGAGTLILAARESSASELDAIADEVRGIIKNKQTETSVHCVSVDITSSSSMASLAAHVRGLCALDVLVLNAGYSGPVVLRVTDGDPQDFSDVFNVNVQGTYLAAHHFIPLLKDANGAKTFVVVNSWASAIVKGHIANTAYCVSKLAQARIVEMVAEQYKNEGVLVHAVHPGAVNTEMADKTTPDSFRSYLVDDVDLCGAFFIWLTREKRVWLSGRLVSAKWDVDELVEKRSEVEEQDLLKFGFRIEGSSVTL